MPALWGGYLVSGGVVEHYAAAADLFVFVPAGDC
jgi:hypothetical protein